MIQDATERLFVPDASVLIKWLVKEKEDQEVIRAMKTDFLDKKIQFLIPAFTAWEINNYLGRKFSASLALKKFSLFRTLKFTELFLSLELSALAFKIMKKCPGVSFYDASYHALALQQKARFITADKTYYKKAKRLGNIMCIKDY